MPAMTSQEPDSVPSAAPRATELTGPCARAFASAHSLTREELLAAPIRWPRPSRLQERLEPAGKRMAAGMEALGIGTVGELLEHLPSDSREARAIGALREGEQATVAVQVRAIGARAVRRRRMRPLVEATVFDASGTMRATFFNQPWLAERYPPGTRLLLHGKADDRQGFRVSHHAEILGGDAKAAAAPSAADAELEPGAGETVAHYPAAQGVSSTQILTLVRGASSALVDVLEPLSASTRVSERLPDRACALAAMHFPRGASEPQAGRERLAFEELLLEQLVFLRRRAGRREYTGGWALSEEPSLSERWLSDELPFEPTGDQRRAIAEIRGDLAQPRPMQRLLLGEVGSGKTVVALYSMLRAVEHGCQAALMAPTETLAEQHFATLQRLIGGEPVAAALLTGSTGARRRKDVLGKLASGELSLVVGTHALIEPDVRFRALAVAVVDEQHRFGVRQRAALEERAARPPHMLHMTATPIPRTLALARYGDLDVSTLRELPLGRAAVDTSLVVGGQARARAYEQLREQLRAGRQAFVVCPLVEDPGEGPGAGDQAAAAGGEPAESVRRAATAELLRLRGGELEGYELALLHGGMRSSEKQEAMAAFASGRADVLVATTVIEVGIDVANATVMLIENADQFGISQLHQLRGRVGRGEHPGVCFLVGPSGESSGRLRALVAHSDGFRLAEIDLGLRKEGELVGTRQSGFVHYRVASLPEDAELLERARARAEAIIGADPELQSAEHVLLGDALEQRFGARALDPIQA
ncbi:MAG: helicase RecG [Solirubrobacterales bacterium]|nr:helicase RecG [Solirubrobacterales bacterium]